MTSVWTLRRSSADGKVAGVCAGLARHADVDPLLVRVAAVLLALSGGLGLVVYGAVWLLTPDEQGRVPADRYLPAARRWSRTTKVVLVAVVCLAVAGPLSVVAPFSVWSAVVLLLIWYFGYYKNRRAGLHTGTRAEPPGVTFDPRPPYATFAGPPTPFTEAAAAWQRRVTEVQRDAARVDAPPAAWPVATAPPVTAVPPGPTAVDVPSADPRAEWDRQQFLAAPDPVGLYAERPVVPAKPVLPRRSLAARRVRLAGLLGVGLVTAGLSVADAVGAPVTLTVYLASALLVVGLTLVVAAFLGRARGILPVGLLLALALAASSSALPLHDLGDWSATRVAYDDPRRLPARQEVAGGELSVDLRRLEVTRDQTYDVELGTGRLRLVLPPDADVEYTVDRGAVSLPDDESRAGARLSGVLGAERVRRTGEPVLTVRARVHLGRLEVRR